MVSETGCSWKTASVLSNRVGSIALTPGRQIYKLFEVLCTERPRLGKERISKFLVVYAVCPTNAACSGSWLALQADTRPFMDCDTPSIAKF